VSSLVVISIGIGISLLLLGPFLLSQWAQLKQLKYRLSQKDRIDLEQEGQIRGIQVKVLDDQRRTIELLKESESNYSHQIQDLREIISQERQEKFSLQEKHAIDRAASVERIEHEKRVAYERGVKDGIKDFTILCQPLCIDHSGWFSKRYQAGYRYTLLVKGIPALDSKDVILQDVSAVDEATKSLIIQSAKIALSAIANSQGIPVNFQDNIQIIDKKSIL
jgi:hypothetical protein